MEADPVNLQQLIKLKNVCRDLVNDSKDIQSLNELGYLVEDVDECLVKAVQPFILSVFYPVLKNISKDKASYSNKEKEVIVEILGNLFKKSNITNVSLFFNFYSFLLFELYDHLHHTVLEINEEYKLAIMKCTINLTKSLTSDLILTVYSKENAPKLCQMIYVAIEIAKKEKMRSLRVAAMECIMSLGRVLDDREFGDVVVRKSVAQVFLYFLPGLASGLKQIALEDEKVGHYVTQVALKAWGRIITLLLQDYNPADNKYNINFLKNKMSHEMYSTTATLPQQKFKDKEAITEYLENVKYGAQWYSETDERLQPFALEFMKITNHSRREVKRELSQMCQIIVENCLTTIPRTVCNLIEIIISMSEDEDNEIRFSNQIFLERLSNELSSDIFPVLVETLEEGFLNGLDRLPRKMNSIDEREQCSSLNLIIGYISLFGRHKLSYVLLSGNHLQKLLNTIIQVCKLDTRHSGLIEEVSSNDLNSTNSKIVWKHFMYIRSDIVQSRLEKLCRLLGEYGTFKLVCDFLLDVFLYEPQHRKESVYILNEVIMGYDKSQENYITIKDILNTYTEDCYWNAALFATIDSYGHQYCLNEVHNNAILVCLLVEGIGNIALTLGKQFEKFTLKLLFMVLEKAGQNHSLVKASCLFALKNITVACGYEDISTLINGNMDYFSFHIERKLHKHDNIENVLRVLSIVLRYSSVDVLNPISFILKEVLVQSCDRFKEAYATEYLKVFKTFIECIWSWYNIQVYFEPIKSRAVQIEETETFKVTGAKAETNSDFSDDIMGKSAEELFMEDMGKKKEDLQKEIEEPEVEEYKKPEPPTHIVITVNVLKTSLNFLPSKDRNQKLLVLQILNGGIEVIKDWEDELLPIVHQIWSPIIGRFKEYQDPLIINYSFQLLITLARLSKEFIRMRTVKEVLPSVLESLQRFSTESYLKDKGSAFRYSQGYKLQLEIINYLGRLMAYLNVQEEWLMEVSKTVFKYLSEKQPIPLQAAAIQFFKDIKLFDDNFMKKLTEDWLKNHENVEFIKNVHLLNQYIESS